MKIGLDISQIVYEGTGVANYTRSLTTSLLKVDKDDEFVFFGASFRRRQLLSDFVCGLSGENFQAKFSLLPPKFLEFLWNGIHVFPIENFVGEVDVFHSSDWLEPPTRKAKRVTTIHDFAVFRYPETFSAQGGHDIVQNQKRKLHFVKNYSDLVIAVSENTKKEAMEILKIPERKIKVIYEAADPLFSPRSKEAVKEIKKKYRIEGDYLLCVGAREPRKNLERVILAFAEIAPAHPNLSLIIAGKYGWGDDQIPSQTGNSQLKTRVKILGFVEKEDLARLYSGAKAYLYPSLYEGFGLPILEAMASSCPVITSNLGAMREVAGNSALLVNPESVDEIATAISKILRNRTTEEELKIRGLKRVGEFSWEKTALQTLEAYHSLLA